jgi:N-methylhydantoinase A
MLLGADIGGTFTDLAWWTGSDLVTYKLSTTPQHPEEALLLGVAQMGAERPDVLVIHGSTIATNALLERKGARIALVTTAGFADVLEIGRQNRRNIYDPRAARPAPLVPRERRLEVRERLDARGRPLEPLSDDEVRRLTAAAAALAPDAIAICLLHAYANSEHERALESALRAVSPFVYRSSAVDPAYREYERASTTALNAYVAPLVSDYVSRLAGRLPGQLRLIGSHGGREPHDELPHPASMILSGPAGGIVGAAAVAKAAGLGDVITFDMGGTSTDVALLPGKPLLTREALVDGLPLRAPMLEIHTVGAGGGSLARFDRGGALVVGPESAGSQPGPACYGRGGTGFTVTDAHVVLGHIPADTFLGGRMSLDAAASRAAGVAAREGRMDSLAEFAEGVLAVANANMERAIRTVSARRGHDPAAFTLVCFGGAGGLHAVDLARSLGMRGVLVPRDAGTLSALGMILADTVSAAQESVLRTASDLTDDALEGRFAQLAERCRDELLADGHPAESLVAEPTLEMRYRGQSYELTVAWAGALHATVEAFHAEHARRFGYADPRGVVEVVTASVTLRALNPGFPLPEILAGQLAQPAHTVTAEFAGASHQAPVYLMDALVRDQRVVGPAILAGAYTTVLLPPDVVAVMDRFGNVRIPLEGES